jgi:hypothetical protein
MRGCGVEAGLPRGGSDVRVGQARGGGFNGQGCRDSGLAAPVRRRAAPGSTARSQGHLGPSCLAGRSRGTGSQERERPDPVERHARNAHSPASRSAAPQLGPTVREASGPPTDPVPAVIRPGQRHRTVAHSVRPTGSPGWTSSARTASTEPSTSTDTPHDLLGWGSRQGQPHTYGIAPHGNHVSEANPGGPTSIRQSQ